MKNSPAQRLGYKIGGLFRVVDADLPPQIATHGSIVELYIDDGSLMPLFKMIKGNTEYNHASGEPGAYIPLIAIEPLERGAQDE
jgi:hypothetical protein